MPAGDGLTDAQRHRIARAVEHADAATGLVFVVRLGALTGGRAEAEALVASHVRPADTVLVAVDPVGRSLEIVTGTRAAAVLDDRACGLASLAMTTSFASGDLVGGVCRGVQLLADHGRSGGRRHLATL